MYLFFDTETTGLPKNWKASFKDLNNRPRLVQLAYLVFDENGKQLLEGNRILRPDNFTIPEEASRVHRITTEIAREKGENLTEVLSDFSDLLGQVDYIVAHNMSFDEKIIGAEFLRIKKENPLSRTRKICTMEKTVDFCAIPGPYGNKRPKLSELYAQLFNRDIENAHDALVDVKATAECFWELKKRGILE